MSLSYSCTPNKRWVIVDVKSRLPLTLCIASKAVYAHSSCVHAVLCAPYPRQNATALWWRCLKGALYRFVLVGGTTFTSCLPLRCLHRGKSGCAPCGQSLTPDYAHQWRWYALYASTLAVIACDEPESEASGVVDMSVNAESPDGRSLMAGPNQWSSSLLGQGASLRIDMTCPLMHAPRAGRLRDCQAARHSTLFRAESQRSGSPVLHSSSDMTRNLT